MKNFRILTIAILLTIMFQRITLCQEFEWANVITGSVGGNSIVTDNNGNSYITGYFYSQANFGNTIIHGYGSNDIFIAKYDVSGNFLWAKNAGSSSFNGDVGVDICFDSEGNILLTGFFSGIATFDAITITGTGSTNAFVAKYDISGNCLWAKAASTPDGGGSRGISADSNGNSYIIGDFWGTIDFGSISLTSIGILDVFIAKYDNNGNLVWAKQVGGVKSEYGFGISVNNSGEFFITGTFENSVTFGSITITNDNNLYTFIAKYDNSGNCIWAKAVGGSPSDVAADLNGNSYLTGNFYSSATFDNIVLTSSGNCDSFVAKFDNNGNCIWAKNAGGTNSTNDAVYNGEITIDNEGNSYTVGYYSGTIKFAPYSITARGITDIFVVKYNNAGDCLWVNSAGGRYIDSGNGIFVTQNGYLTATGQYGEHPYFGAIFFDSWGAFITKISTASGVEETSLQPENNMLYQNYPNPFNPSTTINYNINKAGNVSIIVYNMLGEAIGTLVNEYKNAGSYQIQFNSEHVNGGLPSGVYLYRMQLDNYSEVKKFTLLK